MNRSRKLKIALLIVLSGVLIYIWWGNLKLFFASGGSDTTYMVNPTPKSVASKRSVDVPSLPPKTNPFLRQTAPSRAHVAQPRTLTPTPAAPALHESYSLRGVISQKGHAQAIIIDLQNKSSTVQIGDSVGAWRIDAIGDSAVVASLGKRRDTLRLGYHK